MTQVIESCSHGKLVVERHYDIGPNQIQIARICKDCSEDPIFSMFKIKEVPLN